MTTLLLGVELNGSVHKRLQGATARSITYLPFGHCGRANVGVSAFTGQWLEPASGAYLAGNGYRGYLPRLARFIQPDRYSPFLKGGLNAYVYCAADPVNRVDRTGASFTSLMIGTLIGAIGTTTLNVASLGSKSTKATPRAAAAGLRLGLVAGLVSIASTIAAGALPDNQRPQNVLRWISIGLAGTSAALRLYAFAPALCEAGARKVLGRIIGWRSGRHAPAPANTYKAWINGRS
jgi:RHS repeat-associated protein